MSEFKPIIDFFIMHDHWKRWAIGWILCLGVWGTDAFGQGLGDFLKSALATPEVRIAEQQQALLTRKPYRLPMISEVELRARTNEFGSDRERYALRLNVANPWEVRHNHLFFDAEQKLLALEQSMLLRDALELRYTTVIEWLYLKNLESLNQTRTEKATQRLRAWEQLVGTQSFDAENFIETKLALFDLQLEGEEIAFDQAEQAYQLEQCQPGAAAFGAAWSPEGLPTVGQVKAWLDRHAPAGLPNEELAYQQQALEQAERAYRLEKSNGNIAFVQTGYDQRNQNDGRNPLQLSVGIRLPLVNPNKPDMTKEQLEMIERKEKAAAAQASEGLPEAVLRPFLLEMIHRYERLKAQQSALLSPAEQQQLLRITNGNPLVMWELEDKVLATEATLAKMHRDILVGFVRYLANSGQLQQRPLVNYLSSQMEGLE